MAARSNHGASRKGGSKIVIESMPFDEALVGVQAPFKRPDNAAQASLKAEIEAVELAMAKLQSGAPKADSLKLRGKLGGLRRALNDQIAKDRAVEVERLSAFAKQLLPGMNPADADFAAALPLAQEFIESEGRALARQVGGGRLEPGPASMLISGALQLAAARVLFARGDFKQASLLSEASSSSLARAHEYSARRAVSRTPDTEECTPQRARELMRATFPAIDDAPGRFEAAFAREQEAERQDKEPERAAMTGPPPETEQSAPQLAPAKPAAAKPTAAPGPWEIVQSRRFFASGGPHGIGAGDPRFLVSAEDRAKHETHQFSRELADEIQHLIDSGEPLPKI